jgi:hypothetical protein
MGAYRKALAFLEQFMTSRRPRPPSTRPTDSAAQAQPEIANSLILDAAANSDSASNPAAPTPLPDENEPPKGMTVKEAYEALGRLIAVGEGRSRLGIPYDPGFSTMGSAPFMPITGFHQGIDWDHGRVTARPETPLSARSTELSARLRRMEQQQGQTILMLRRLQRILDSESVLGAPEVLREAADLIGATLHAHLNRPGPVPQKDPGAAPPSPASIPSTHAPASQTVFLLPRAPGSGKPGGKGP